MRQPRLLDAFSGAGGAGMGYHMAGFDVVGVDHKPQKRYPFDFVLADALEYIAQHGHEFDAIHASPPCQAHTALRAMHQDREYVDLIPETRETLFATGVPFVIENVPGSSTLRPLIMLCGTMFGLRTECGAELRRHRYFEVNFHIGMVPGCQHYAERTCTVAGHSGGSSTREYERRTVTVTGGGPCYRRLRPRTITVCGDGGGMSRERELRAGIDARMFSLKDRRTAMGIDWMTGAELSQAIPPAYTRFIGMSLMEHLRQEVISL